MIEEQVQKQAQNQELLFQCENSRGTRTSSNVIAGAKIELYLSLSSCDYLSVFLVKMEHVKARARNVFEYFLYQPTKALISGLFVVFSNGRGRRKF